jgi:multiple sugar transport system substrate-binding protein
MNNVFPGFPSDCVSLLLLGRIFSMAEIEQPTQLSRRRFMKQSALAAGVTLGAASWLAACGGSPSSSGPVTITVMDDFQAKDDTTFSDRWVKIFEQQNPKIKVNRIAYDQQKLSAMLAAGSPPDIIKTSGGPEITSLAARGLALDLTAYFQQSSLLKEDDLQPVNDFYRWDGTTQGKGPRYGMTHDWSQDGMYWIDTAVFDAAHVPYPSQTQPLSFDELLALGERLTVRQGGKIKVYGMGTNWDYPQQLMMFLNQQGLSIYKNGDLSQMDFTQPEVKKIYQWCVDWAQAHVGDSPLDSTSDWYGTLMPAKRYGMAAAGLWFGGFMESTSPATRERMLLLPAPQWGSVKRVSPSYGGTGWWIAKGSKHPDEAWKVFEFYMGGPPAEYRAQTGNGLSPLKHLFDALPQKTSFDKQAYAVQQAELAYYATLQFTPYITPQAISSILDSNLTPVMQGKSDLDNALQQINTSVNQLLQQAKSLIG